MGFVYRGAVAIVTGASSGIGAAVARDLAKRGTTVVGAARRQNVLEAVIEDCRRGAPASEAVVCDVGERDQVEGLVRGVLERHGRVDVLVNNAGMPMRVHASRLTPEQAELIMRVVYFGTVWATLAVLPSMLERRSGHLVNVSSVAGRIVSPREAAYTAAKHAVAGWSESLAADLTGTGIGVHLIIPGPIEAESWSKVQEPAAYRGKLHPPEGIAAAIRDCLEHGKFERWFPRSIAAMQIFRLVAPRAYIRSAARFDRRADKPPKQ